MTKPPSVPGKAPPALQARTPVTAPKLPAIDAAKDVVFASHANYARDVVHTAFQMLGGVQAYVEWARDNPDDFYNKHFAKTIQRDVAVTGTLTVESLVERLDEVDGGYMEASDEDADE